MEITRAAERLLRPKGLKGGAGGRFLQNKTSQAGALRGFEKC
jgi:hypothetical protein